MADTILPVMIGTAGHVDHGKTSLVHLLTGCNTDKLKDEQERGLTIDLGFAPCRFSGGRLAGIVDVPGHEDFIRNMVAGAASIDILLLAIAADDGIMPQTVEHLRIVSLLRRPQLLIALTKTDLVPPETVAARTEEIYKFLEESGFSSAQIVPCSCKSLDGISKVRHALQEMVDRAAKRLDARQFRLFVERRFSIKGYGTVVTGVPVSGTLGVGQQVEGNAGTFVVRALQSYTQERDEVCAGACAAVNLRDLPVNKIKRGDCLYAPGLYTPVQTVVAGVRNVDDKYVFKKITRVRLHSGTFSVNATVKLLDTSKLSPGNKALASIKLERPCVLCSGDNFVLRNPAGKMTIGGGVVLSGRLQRVKAGDEKFLDRLLMAEDFCAEEDYAAAEILAGKDMLINDNDLCGIFHMSPTSALHQAVTLEKAGVLQKLKNAWVVICRIADMVLLCQKRLTKFHEKNPYLPGADAAEVCGWLGTATDNFELLAQLICDDGVICCKNGLLALADFAPPVSAKQQELIGEILKRVEAAGITPPARGKLKEELGVTEAEYKTALRLLHNEGKIAVVDNHIIMSNVLKCCRQQLVDCFVDKEVLGIKDWRQACGASRNFAVSLLEYFDKQGLTRRVDGGRVLMDNSLHE